MQVTPRANSMQDWTYQDTDVLYGCELVTVGLLTEVDTHAAHFSHDATNYIPYVIIQCVYGRNRTKVFKCYD